ncbi:MAG TPA: M28 family peptidase [Gemmatimonadales bacterium]|nr:M28 family peptidase [Gemmatimonadales bacterium]
MKFAPSSRTLWIAGVVLASALPLAAQEPVDQATVNRIKSEEMEHGQVMDIMSWLSDVYGPRLTWSPNATRAKDWAVGLMKSWGLANVHTELWTLKAGQAGYPALGWENERFALQAIAPVPFIIEAVPQAWSVGTLGPVTGPAVLIDAGCTDEIKAKYAGKLRNAFLLPTPAQDRTVSNFAPTATRLTDSALAALNEPAAGRGPAPAAAPVQRSAICQKEATRDSMAAVAAGRGGRGGRGGVNVADTTLLRWLKAQGVAAMLLGDATHTAGDIGTNNGASRILTVAHVPSVHVALESYGRIARMLAKKVPVTLQLNMRNTYFPANTTSFDIIGEIPGTDPALKDQVVMIGAHFDSWHSGTGATDNGAGSGTMLEAIRLLKSLNLQPRRTIRIGLWTGEEQGLLGSQAYTRAHYGTRDSSGFHATPEQKQFDVYFNVDNGSGRIRGVYMEGIEAERPIFDAWMKAVNDPTLRTVTLRNTTGTDHQSFVTANMGVGLPGFQFIQDPLDYGNVTHHTNQDVYEHVQPEDMKFNAVVVASFAWLASQREGMIPRPPEPGPLTGRGGRGGR